MGGFLIVQNVEGQDARGASLFQIGVKNYTLLKEVKPVGTHQVGTTRVAKFGRIAARTDDIAKDPRTESWLVSMGTWLYPCSAGTDRSQYLLNEFLKKRERVIEDLDGFFVIAFYEGRQKELVVVTDRIGSCHAYLCFQKGLVLLSSSSMLLASLTRSDLDMKSCYEFLNTGTIFEDRTLYRGIQKLEPAMVYRFKTGHLQAQRQYWSLGSLPIGSLAGEKTVDLLSEALIQTAYEVQAISTHPLCDLTGGYDSRSILAVQLATGAKFSTVVNGSVNHPDVIAANRIGKVLGLDHYHNLKPKNWPAIFFTQAKEAHRVTDGEYDILEYASTYTNHQAFTKDKGFDLSLNGSGGEVARGYWWELLFPYTGWSRRISFRKLAERRYGVSTADPSVFSPEMSFDLVDHFTAILEHENRGLRHLPNTAQMDNSYLRLRMQRWQGRIASSTNQIWPCLSIFLCRQPLEVSLCVVPSLRRHSLLTRKVLEKLNPHLASLPLENGCPALPMRWSNLHRFYPFLGDFRKRLFKKMAQRISYFEKQSPISGGQDDLLKALWREEEVQDLLDVSKMRTVMLYDQARLCHFFERSKHSGFLRKGHLGKILTLERTVRLLQSL